MNPGIKRSIQLGGHVRVCGTHRPGVIICTGLIYVLLSYPDGAQRGGARGGYSCGLELG